MKCCGPALRLRDDPAIRRYVEYHRAVWPEVARGLKSIGVRLMLVFQLGRQLLMYMETDDGFEPERNFPRYEASSAHQGVAGPDGFDAGASA